MKTFRQFCESVEACDVSNEPISRSQLKVIENVLDKLFASLKIDVVFTKHFFDRLNDRRNKRQITPCELIEIYKSLYQKFGVKISKTSREIEKLITSITSNINIPVKLEYDRNTKEVNMVAKTIMRKKGFKSDTSRWSVD